MKALILIAVIAALITLASAQRGVCVLVGTKGYENVKGLITIEPTGDGKANISGTVEGVAANSEHGIHIHVVGDVSNENGTATLGHYNPLGVEHGFPGSIRHVGDMGNFTANDMGVITLDHQDDQIKVDVVDGPLSVIGRAIIVHSTFDNGSGGINGTGAAGARIAQCVIGIASNATNTAVASNATTAVCSFKAVNTANNVKGKVIFTQVGDQVKVEARVCGLVNESHGFHVHTFGDISNSTSVTANVGGHYNPFGLTHAYPNNPSRHVGDMGNITRSNDELGGHYYNAMNDLLSLVGDHSIVGRAVIIHNTNDDGGALNNGNAGPHFAYCVIGVADSTASLSDISCPVQPQASSHPTKKSSDASPVSFGLVSLALVAAAALFA